MDNLPIPPKPPSTDAAGHSLFGASKAWQWAGYPGEPGCPASAVLAARLPPEPSSPAAQEGTLAHSHLEFALKHPEKWRDHRLHLPLEMAAGVQQNLDYIVGLERLYPRLRIWIEEKLRIQESIGGTSDQICYCPDTNGAWAVDFKYGKQPVSPVNNPQLLTYALGAREQLGIHAWGWTLVIVQPRAFANPGVKEWHCGPEVLDLWKAQIDRAVQEAHRDPPLCRPSEKRCRWCRAAAICPEMAAQVSPPPPLPLAFVQPPAPRKKAGQPKEPAPPPFLRETVHNPDGTQLQRVEAKDVSPSVLAKIGAALDGLPAIKAYAKAVDDLANELMLVQNLEIPGQKLVYSSPRAEWVNDEWETATLLLDIAHLPREKTMPPGLVSITRAKELVAEQLRTGNYTEDEKEAIWQRFAELLTRGSSKTKIRVPVSDPRTSAAQLDFDDFAVDGAEEICMPE